MTTPELERQAPDYIFLDLDLTVIDEQWNITDPSILEAIREARAADMEVILHSDASPEMVEYWQDKLGIPRETPYIAERGGVVWWNGQPHYDEEAAARYAEKNRQISERLADNNILVWPGNAVDLLHHPKAQGLASLQPGQRVVVMNTRRLGLSAFVRRVGDDGTLLLDAADMEAVNELIADLYLDSPQGEQLRIDINPDYGHIMAVRGGYTKRAGVEWLLAMLGHTGEPVMIGNSMSDHLGPRLVVHYAVGNADPDYAEAADFVAPGRMSTSVAWILRRLVRVRQRA
jgi:hydroxymethylpyrimidine pyrophosphatase-like HAD family hydrolase